MLAPYFYADAFGLFKDVGFKLKNHYVSTGGEVIQLFTAGDADIQAPRFARCGAKYSVYWRLVAAVKTFDAFSEDNDPYGERDFGAVELEGERYFWKIDYYDRSLRFGAEDPCDISETVRVMTLMHASEY